MTAPLPATIETLFSARTVGLLDVSADGARIYGEELPEVGAELTFRCGRIEAIGTVAWAACGQIGIHFHSQLSRNEIARLRYEGDLTRLAGMTGEDRMDVEARRARLAR